MEKQDKKSEENSSSASSESQGLITLKSKVMDTLILTVQLVDDHLPQIIHAYQVLSGYLDICKKKWNKNFNSDMNYVILGFFLSFYGGNFAALITTATAIHQSGQWSSLKKGVIAAYGQFKEAFGVLQEDAIIKALDTNKDGKVSLFEMADALNKDGRGLLVTVLPHIIKRVDPNVMNEAITSIWAIWCSVMITLRSMFAGGVAMGMQVGDAISITLKLYLAPAIVKIVDKNSKVWVDYGVLIGCKFIGVLVAMMLRKLIGGFTCAMLGGEMFAKGMMPMVRNYVTLSVDDAMNWQSIATYVIGGIGFLYQLKSGFSMSITFQLLLAPAVIAEMLIGLFVYTG